MFVRKEDVMIHIKGAIKGGLLTLLVLLTISIGAASCDNAGNAVSNTEITESQEEYEKIEFVSGLLKPYNLDDLIEKSDAIVIGKVIEILPSEYGPNYKRNMEIIHTDIVIEVYEYLLGKSESKLIAVRLWEGTVNDDQIVLKDGPKFVIGEETVLYLALLDVKEGESPNNIATNAVYRIIGGIQGKAKYANSIVSHQDITGSQLSITELSEKIISIHSAK
jgi:hypothetical protein